MVDSQRLLFVKANKARWGGKVKCVVHICLYDCRMDIPVRRTRPSCGVSRRGVGRECPTYVFASSSADNASISASASPRR